MDVELLALTCTTLYGLPLDCVVASFIQWLSSYDLYSMALPAFASFCEVVRRVPECWEHVESRLRSGTFYHATSLHGFALTVRASDIQSDVSGKDAWHEMEIYRVAFPRAIFVLTCMDETNS